MIVDYISPENLPHLIVWMDWQLYAHGNNYIIMIAFGVMIYYLSGMYKQKYANLGSFIIVMTAFFFVQCYIRYGIGVG